ncbi:MAG: hypothetical protein ACFE8U_01495 [Candidatus Hermodarchaeota archaeon]
MKKNLWLERGLAELRQENWFDGFQMIQGALQRAFRFNKPDSAKEIITEAIAQFSAGKKEIMACKFLKNLIKNLCSRHHKRNWVELIPFSFDEMRKMSFEKCIRNICNQIIAEKTFQDSQFLQHLDNLILEAKYNKVVSDLYFCYSGLLCLKKDFVACHEVIEEWSKESPLTLIMRAYLTLAELNAYEIEGYGKYLQIDNQNYETELSSNSESKEYLEIATQIFDAVESSNSSEFYSIITTHSDLIDSKNDGLLKALCDGIADIFKPRSDPGLFSSLFRS